MATRWCIRRPESYWGNVNTIGPRGCYDESKRFAEALTMAYHREHGVDTRIVRIFNTYGPRMRLRDGRVVPAFISQALKNQPLTVFGQGEQTRSFCYCSDLIEGIYRLMMSRAHEPVNIGNPAEMTMLEFAREIIAATGSRSKISFPAACRRMIRASGGRTSARAQRNCWAGNRGWRWGRGLSRPLTISGAGSVCEAPGFGVSAIITSRLGGVRSEPAEIRCN